MTIEKASVCARDGRQEASVYEIDAAIDERAGLASHVQQRARHVLFGADALCGVKRRRKGALDGRVLAFGDIVRLDERRCEIRHEDCAVGSVAGGHGWGGAEANLRPGAMALKRILYGTHKEAKDFDNETTAALLPL